MHAHDITQPHAQIFSHHLVHSNLPLLTIFIRQDDAHRVLSLFTLEQHRVSSKQLQLVHLLQIQRDDRVIVVHRFIYRVPRDRARLGQSSSPLPRRDRRHRVDIASASRSRATMKILARRTDDESVRRFFTLENGRGDVLRLLLALGRLLRGVRHDDARA